MREEYSSVLSTPTEADKIGRFGRYRYIGKTQMSARPIYRSISSADLSLNLLRENISLFSEQIKSTAMLYKPIFQSVSFAKATE